MNWITANAYCQNKGSGWHLPSYPELVCMCINKSTLPGGLEESLYWSRTHYANTNYYGVYTSDCKPDYHQMQNGNLVKCVK